MGIAVKKKKPTKAARSKRGSAPGRRILSSHPRRIGRRSDLTNDKAIKIVKALTIGSHFNVACAYAGVPESTAYNWLDRGNKELDRLLKLEASGESAPEPLATELPFLEFLEHVQYAESQGEISAVTTIKSFSRKDWRAAMAFLEHRHKARWGQRLELAGDPEAPLQSHVVLYVPDNKRGPKSEETPK